MRRHSAESLTITATALTVAAPSGLTATASRTTVTLRWTDNSSNEGGFYVERAPKGSTAFARVGQTGANATTFSQTVARGQYVYRVQAFNGTTVSAYSNQASVRVR